MANVPGTEGPVDYPNRPEGGPWGGENASEPLPGGTARWPEPSPANMPTPAMGAGVPGTGGLTPNPGEPTSGSIQKGYKGDGYASAAPPNVEADEGWAVAQEQAGAQGVSGGGIDVPSDFTTL